MKTDKDKPKIAYLILAHTDPEQLFALVKSLDYNAKIYIHLDAKSNIKDFKNFDYPEHVQFIEDRLRVTWAGINMVSATLNLIKAAIDEDINFSHLVLLSGLDYPIKPISSFYNLLINHSNKEFIRFINVNDSPEHYLRVYRRFAFTNAILPSVSTPVAKGILNFSDKALRKILRHLFKPIKKKPIKGIIPCFGSSWWAITPGCATYILNYIDENPEFFKYSKSSFAPDEYFFHTIIGNSPFSVASDGFQPYTGRGTYKMANFHIIHPSLSKIYTIHDFEELKKSDKFFVRKVTSEKSQALIKKIRKELL